MEYQNLVIMDVETGGLDKRKHPITQIGLLALNGNNYEEIIKYDTFVKPYAGLEITERALQASRVTMNDIKHGIEIEKAVREVEKILKNLLIKKRNTNNNKPILIGHNVGFDIGFLSFAFQLFQKEFIDYFHPIAFDTLTMMKRSEVGKKLDNGIKYNLTSCVERLGLKLFSAHGAMDDVYATAEVFKVLDVRLRESNGEGNYTGEIKAKKKSRKFFEFTDF